MHYLEPMEDQRRIFSSSTDPERLRNRMIERNEESEHGDVGTDVEVAKALLDMDPEDRRVALALISDDQLLRIEKLF